MAITLVTGAAGFIGSHLSEALVKSGRKVRGLVQKESLNINHIRRAGVEVVYGDILDKESLKSALQGVDTVYHLAAMLKPSKWIYSKAGLSRELDEVNYEGTKLLAELSLGKIKNFIFCSSIAAAGAGPAIDEACETEPSTEYGQSKRKAERYLLELHKKGLPLKIIRPGTVYGPRNMNMTAIFKFIDRGFFPSFGKGENSLPFTYIEHLVGAFLLVEEKGNEGEAYFVVEDAVPFRDLARVSAAALGRRLSGFYVPKWLVFGGLFVKDLLETLLPVRLFPLCMDIRFSNARIATGDWICSNKKIKELGYKPSFTFADSVGRTARWYKENGLL